MSEKIAIIGSNSFSGSHLIHHALAQGLSVLGLSHSVKKSIPFNPYDWKMGSKHNLTLEQLDANDHPNKTINIINDYQPHRIIHCTANGRIEIQDQLENKPSLIVTPAACVYGPGQQVHKLIPKIILSILLGKKFLLRDGSHAMQSFIHINDVVTGTFQVASKGVSGETYHFLTHHSLSTRDLVALTCKRMNTNFENVVTIVEDRSNQIAASISIHSENHRKRDVSVQQNGHLREDNFQSNLPASLQSSEGIPLDWQSTVELEQGIDSVIDWAQEWLPALKNHWV